jgi:hypothetical protein
MKKVNDILTQKDWTKILEIFPEIKKVVEEDPSDGELRIPGIIDADYVGDIYGLCLECPYGHNEEDCDCVYIVGLLQERPGVKIDRWGYLTIT